MRIGYYKFTTAAELHIVNNLGDSVPLNEEALETEIEVECVLHCDDPEDGVYGEIINAAVLLENFFLNEEAIECLDLSVEAGEKFNDGGIVPPKAGTKWKSISDGHIWTVVGSGKLEDCAAFYIWLERPLFNLLSGDEKVGMTIQDYTLYQETLKDGKRVPCWRQVIDEDPPGPGEFRVEGAIYRGEQ